MISGNETIGGRGYTPPNFSWPQTVTAGGNGLGGGIYFDPCVIATITNCVIAANNCVGGSGGYISNSNHAPDGSSLGGGVFCGSGGINGCTFCSNKAIDAVGICGSPMVSNCILWDNAVPPPHGRNEISGGAVVQYSDVKYGFTGKGNIYVDPCFVKLGYWAGPNDPNYVPPPPFDSNMGIFYSPVHSGLTWVEGDYHLRLESLCIDTGDPNYVAEPNETDLDGNRRVVAGRIDMGAYEYPNNLPVANAGPNQAVYARKIDGIAEVNLDGSGSYDADGDALTYLWKWSIDGNDYETNGVNPTIELPVGQYTIELVVNDGREDSEPNQVVITIYEYPNTAPVADAGANQVVYAWIDGIAEVNLDGSGSYDPDGDELIYSWKWTIDGNDYNTTGVKPTIELPVGQSTLELVVNDGREDSEPNQVVVTVVEPIKSTLCIVPKIINWRSGQPRILAMLRLPAGIGRKQIDQKQKLLLYPGKIESSFQLVLPCGQRGVEQCRILAYFDKSELMDAVGNAGMVQLEVVGHLKTGQYFFGSDKVGVIKPPRKPVWRWTGY